MTIRPATEADAEAIARICLLTGAQGGDATGKFSTDTLQSDVYATPYLYGPGCYCLVWDVDGEAQGYILGTADTRAFQTWFSQEWWPQRASLHPARTEADPALLTSVADPKRMLIAQVDDYPAHLHIDLLPSQQGRGVGRQLMDACVELLRSQGVTGLHLTAERANAGAQAFYPRVGFTAIHEDEATVTFARTLA